MENIIEVSGLKKSYGNLEAVRGIDFYVKRGQMFAFLGPNGAGKSTTIDILCTLLRFDAGEAVIDGHPLSKEDEAIRSSIGVVFQDHLLDPLLTVRENLLSRARLYPGKRNIRAAAYEAARAADALDFIDRPYGKLSGGQKRRADIARALVNTPKILFLDEPTTGLDPQTKQSVWSTVKGLQQTAGMTLFLTTHYMEEAAAADYITIIDRGLITASGTPLDLKQKHASDSVRIKASDGEALSQLLSSKGIAFSSAREIFTVNLKSTRDAIPIICAAEQYIESFEVLHGTMDDVFIAVTGKEVREDA